MKRPASDISPWNVVITINGQQTKVAINPSNGWFSTAFPTATLPVRKDIVTYDSPESSDNSEAIDTKTSIVVSAATATTLTSSLTSATYVQALTFTVKMSSQAGGTPIGSVTFRDGNTPLYSTALRGGMPPINLGVGRRFSPDHDNLHSRCSNGL